MANFEDGRTLKVPALTKSERKWIEELEEVLLRCPKRLGLVTIGDPYLLVIDEKAGHNSELCDGAAYRDRIVLAEVRSASAIQGVSG